MRRGLELGIFAVTAAVVGALGIGAAQSGCTVLTNDAPPDDATFEAGNEASISSCEDCVTQACIGQWATCLTDDDCRAVRECAAPSNKGNDLDPKACFCTSDRPGAYLALTSCNDAKPSSACASFCTGGSISTTPSCGGDGGSDAGPGDAATEAGEDAAAPDAAAPDAAAPVTVDGCTNCINGACGDPKKACATGTECPAYLSCTYVCKDDACETACATNHATGKESAVELANCVKASCASACGL